MHQRVAEFFVEARGLRHPCPNMKISPRPARRMPFWEQPAPALADPEEPQASLISLS